MLRRSGPVSSRSIGQVLYGRVQATSDAFFQYKEGRLNANPILIILIVAAQDPTPWNVAPLRLRTKWYKISWAKIGSLEQAGATVSQITP